MMLTDLADACRGSGLKLVEIPGWETRGRPASTGGFDPQGILCHHTGGAANDRAYAEWMALTGRSDLPAPLAQLALDRQGTVYVLAAGRANHAGAAKASGPLPAGDGNSLYVGIEAMNTGSEDWTAVQYAAYVALCAALCDHYGWSADHVRAHRETSTTGKWDPGLLDMPTFRRHIEEAAMPSADEIVNALMSRNLTAKDGELTVAKALRKASTAAEVLEAINDLPAQIELNLPTTSSLTRADVRQATTTAVRRLLGRLDEEK